jgi:rhodanese-related sulfurtransferase
MRKKTFAALGTLFLLMATMLSSMDSLATEPPPRITKEELKQHLGDPKVVIVDVRAGRDWSKSDRKISGAVREEPNDAGTWATRYPKDNLIVLYCA